MDSFNTFLLTLDGYLGSSSWFPFILLGVGLFFTVNLKAMSGMHAVLISQTLMEHSGNSTPGRKADQEITTKSMLKNHLTIEKLGKYFGNHNKEQYEAAFP